MMYARKICYKIQLSNICQEACDCMPSSLRFSGKLVCNPSGSGCCSKVHMNCSTSPAHPLESTSTLLLPAAALESLVAKSSEPPSVDTPLAEDGWDGAAEEGPAEDASAAAL